MRPGRARATIARRLALASASLVFATGAVTLAVAWLGTNLWLDYRAEDSVGREFDSLVARHEKQGPMALSNEIERRMRDPESHGSIYIYTEARYELIAGNVPSWPAGLDADESGRMSLEVVRAGGQLLRRVEFGSRSLPDGRHLLVGRDVTEDEQLMRTLALAMLGALVVTALFGIAGGLSMSRRLLGRVTRMNQTVLGIIGGRGHERVPHDDEGDEFDALAKHFNLLLDENDRLIARMREVTDDIAHDLRTPLARMRTRIESALGKATDPDSFRETLDALAGDTDRILETFNDLIHIAKIESRSIREEMDALSLDDVVRDVVELYEPLAEEAGVRLVPSTGSGAVVRGSRPLISRALTNLLDNAIKYAAGSGEIDVAAHVKDGRAVLMVRDRGPGIPASERGHVLERFVRLDASRGRPGSGLGLSFVAAVAAHHLAELQLSDAEPGLRVRIVFPSA